MDLENNWDDLPKERTIAGLAVLFERLMRGIREDDDDELTWEIVSLAAQYEMEDYFGTKGLEV